MCGNVSMRGWCRYPRSNSTHEGQISEIDMLVRLDSEGFEIGLIGEQERNQITLC